MESDATRMCELLVGLPAVNVLGIESDANRRKVPRAPRVLEQAAALRGHDFSFTAGAGSTFAQAGVFVSSFRLATQP